MKDFIKRVEDAVRDLHQGKMIILTDHPDRENEGDLIYPAEKITPKIINFMIRHCSGIICLPMLAEQLKKLDLSYMVAPHENTSQRATPFTVSIEAKKGITTGVSAKDRATTILAAIKNNASPEDIVKPGHIFPLHANENGVLARQGHTEGAIDLVRLAGFKPAAVLCEIMNPDGTMSCGNKLKTFAKKYRIKIISIEDLIAYRMRHENLIAEESSATLPLEAYGRFQMTVIQEKITGREHLVLTAQHKAADHNTLVRIHSSCITGDLFGSERCDCNKQLHYSLEKISKTGGILIYLNQEGRGIGLLNKMKAYALQETGLDTVEANQYLGLPPDARQYYIAANFLRNKGIKNIRLLTNNPHKIVDLKKFGDFSVKQEKIPLFVNKHNKKYLKTKKEKLKHHIKEIL